MTDALSVCNLGLGKIAASRITSLSPPRTPLERHCAAGYPTWRDEEITKRRWVFATDIQPLTQAGGADAWTGVGYKFVLPVGYLRAIRNKWSTFHIRGAFIYDCNADLTLEFLKRVPEAQFDALFVNVLACRVAMESVEFATQSNTKGQTADQKYAVAVNDAGRNNAFIIGPEDVTTPDDDDSWIRGRYGLTC